MLTASTPVNNAIGVEGELGGGCEVWNLSARKKMPSRSVLLYNDNLSLLTVANSAKSPTIWRSVKLEKSSQY